MERYDNYKDSGVDWIGQIPEKYSVTKLKYLSNLFGRIGFRGYNSDDLNQEGVGAITISPSNITETRLDLSKVTYLSWDKYYESPEIQVCNNDILLVKTGSSYGKSCYVSNLAVPATINPQLLRIVPKCFYKFLYYYLQSFFFTYEINCCVAGSTIPTLSQANIGGIYVVIPSTDEQKAIATYLDEETGKLDAAVEKLERMVEVLKERKQLIISKAVTRGLDDSVPLKDSGVEWIGHIPEHWNQLQLKYLVSCNDDVLPESTKNQLIKYVEISDVDSTSGIKQFTIYNFADAPSRARRITNIGDIIVSTVRTYFKAIARVDQDDLVVSTGFAVLRAKNIDRNFLFYSLLNETFLQQVIAYSYGVSFPAITSKELLRIKLNIPPLSEQQAIAAYLDEKVGKLDEAIEKQLRMIELLKERKQILISDVVTGKIKVAQLVIALQHLLYFLKDQFMSKLFMLLNWSYCRCLALFELPGILCDCEP